MGHNWRPEHKWSKERMKQYDQERRLKDPVGSLIRGAQKRAKLKGIDFNLTKADLQPYPTVCPVFGIPLQYKTVGRQVFNSASLDRFDNTLGYVKGNVRIISLRANELKRDGKLEEFKAIIKYMENNIEN